MMKILKESAEEKNIIAENFSKIASDKVLQRELF
jgi:hypothetical protein